MAVFNRHCSISDMEPLIESFKTGVTAEVGEGMPSEGYLTMLGSVEGLAEAVAAVATGESAAEQAAAIEFVLEGLHLNKRLNKDSIDGEAHYRG